MVDDVRRVLLDPVTAAGDMPETETANLQGQNCKKCNSLHCQEWADGVVAVSHLSLQHMITIFLHNTLIIPPSIN